MKRISISILLVALVLGLSYCNKVSYRKTKSGLAYKLFPGKGTGPMVKDGEVAKFEVTTKLNDSVMYSSYGKMPGYAKVVTTRQNPYNIIELFPLMRVGDSAVAVQMIDSLMKQGIQLPENAKKGDRVITTFKILEIFPNDSIGMINYKADLEKDKPRQMKEQEEQMAKMKEEEKKVQQKEYEELQKSGEIARELKDMDTYLAAKKVTAQKTGKGTYVYVQEKGTGPAAQAGKYVRVKYTGKILTTDSIFQSNVYAFKLGVGEVIQGWDEGLVLFNQGGKGTIYVPGFLGYGSRPPQGSPFKPFEPLKFEIEMLNVSDTILVQQ